LSDSLTYNGAEETYPGYHPWWHPKDRTDFGMFFPLRGKSEDSRSPLSAGSSTRVAKGVQ
jgi:hypothetical protein